MTRGAGIELFARDLVFPEGPTWHDGALWVSDVIAGGVVRLDADGAATTRWLDGRRGIGGLVTTDDGRLLATGADLVDVATGRDVVQRPPGATGFNDIGVDADGALLIGVLTYRPLAGEPPSPGAVARVDGDVIDWSWFPTVEWPNGIGLLSNGDIVVADYSTGVLWLLGAAGRPRMICRSPSGHYDGLCVDGDDGIWVATSAGGTIEHREVHGALVDQIVLPAGFVSSACFSGADPHTLLVTVSGCTLSEGSGAVLAVPVAVEGAPPRPARAPLDGFCDGK